MENWMERGVLDFFSVLERGAVIRVQLTGAWSKDAKIGWSVEGWRPRKDPTRIEAKIKWSEVRS